MKTPTKIVVYDEEGNELVSFNVQQFALFYQEPNNTTVRFNTYSGVEFLRVVESCTIAGDMADIKEEQQNHVMAQPKTYLN